RNRPGARASRHPRIGRTRRRARDLRAHHARPGHTGSGHRRSARMRARVTPLLPLALMAFLGLLTLWLQYAVREGAGGDSRPPSHNPDAIIENFTIQNL